MMKWILAGAVGLASAASIAGGCSSDAKAPSTSSSTTTTATTGSTSSSSGGGGAVEVKPLIVSTANRTPRTTTWSVNYWQWMPSYGDGVTGTETAIAALHPAVLRVGGYNNDANIADPFDDAEFDDAIAYAHAIGAEPLIQVPHLQDVDGNPPTPATGAAMVTYANVTKKYGVKYFAVGNEPDVYLTQGLPSDQTQPAKPNYTPAEYCASVAAYVEAMKAVDPTIKIVGPDLGFRYQAGSPEFDWLTPILTQCGNLFDIISIHRYPFEAKLATLSAASADPAAFRNVIASVRGILQATGQSNKPLALMEMNVVYDATTCVLEASPGTLGSALWLADSLGTAIELGLWTSAVWDIADTDPYTLGLIDMPPGRVPRPPYYAYALFADHFGPTLVNVTNAPTGVSAHASRNQADDATEIIVVNWNQAEAGLAFQVTDLASPPSPSTFVLPPTSIAAVEIPDKGTAKAWVYGEAQRRTKSGPQAIEPGDMGSGADTGPADGGAGRSVGLGCSKFVCSNTTLASPVIMSNGMESASGSSVQFGSSPDKWGSYSYAAPNQVAPTATATADGKGLQIKAGFTAPVDPAGDYEGVGLYYSSAQCVDGSAYTGVKFDFAGDLGSCMLQVSVAFSGVITAANDPVRGGCGTTSCYGPSTDVTAQALAATPASPTIQVPFQSLTGGMPVVAFDASSIVNVQWQLTGPTSPDGGGCSAQFTVSNASFY